MAPKPSRFLHSDYQTTSLLSLASQHQQFIKLTIVFSQMADFQPLLTTITSTQARHASLRYEPRRVISFMTIEYNSHTLAICANKNLTTPLSVPKSGAIKFFTHMLPLRQEFIHVGYKLFIMISFEQMHHFMNKHIFYVFDWFLR